MNWSIWTTWTTNFSLLSAYDVQPNNNGRGVIDDGASFPQQD
ncbi:hypothetical protein [Brevibacillus laterosporus]|nr:hypothetical protein [Brevibacillus laterosporus]